MDVVLGEQVQEGWEAMGCLAWFNCLLDHLCDESGIVRFPALLGNGGRSRAMAFGHSWTNGVVVQVSAFRRVSGAFADITLQLSLERCFRGPSGRATETIELSSVDDQMSAMFIPGLKHRSHPSHLKDQLSHFSRWS